MKKITIKGARQHNLKGVDLELPRDQLIVVTGVSGSGKSSLAFDTIYAEGQRRYVESLSAYARQFLSLMPKPEVDVIEGLSPAISIEQRTVGHNPRSTVGTITEIWDYLRLLFARIGVPHCPEHGIPITAQTPQAIAAHLAAAGGGQVTLLAPLVRQKKGAYVKFLADLFAEGFARVRVDGRIVRSDEKIKLARYEKHDIDVVIDRLDPADGSRLAEACEAALARSDGLLIAIDAAGRETTYSARLACPVCGVSLPELQPRLFSFNSPFGACERCDGLGIRMDFDPELIIPDRDRCLADGAVAMYRNLVDSWRGQYLAVVAKDSGFDALTPIRDLSEEQLRVLLYGSDRPIRFHLKMKKGEVDWSHVGRWEGLVPQAERLYAQTESEYRRRELEKFMRISPCPACGGKRLKPQTLAVKVAGHSIAELADWPVVACREFFDALELSPRDAEIARPVLKEIRSRLRFLEQVGLDYLTLSRAAGTLSGGEGQRIRLATQIGANLMGVLYILDEPSIGLHQRDNRRLIDTLCQLRDLGNTLVVVEHDEDTIRQADYVVDLGPGAGIHGGEVLATGTPAQIMKSPRSLTGQYLTGKLSIPVPTRRRPARKFLTLNGCRENNLKNITVKIPLGTLTLVTGVSGSGKSTLVNGILYKALMARLYGSRERPGKHDSLVMDEPVDRVIVIDQSPIGKTPRSNPATYIKVFDDIRQLFANTVEAKTRGYGASRFSFNLKGGRCEACQGDGMIKIEMNFLPDVYVECEECKGSRYNRETLAVTFKGKSIADVLRMSVEEALEFFAAVPRIAGKLGTLADVGLSYIALGQSSTTLSGGEAQRIKLTRELAKRDTGHTLYLLDEPTTGLHFHDVRKLIEVLDRLVGKGNTVVVIEHNLDVIRAADWIIDLGPEGGDRGGRVVTSGTPEKVARVAASYTGQFLKGKLDL